ncbi:ribose ABC transporter ATP-binding protein [Clostridia bacterium]|nr:ribose ABC transporter ATP-binding protein [Clostridia bacterium]
MDNVTLEKDNVRLLDRFNLHLFSGEIMGLVFADYRGKRTFISVVSQNAPLNYGNVFFAEKLINSYIVPHPHRTQGVSVIGQTGTLIGEMSVAENVLVMRRNFRKYVIDTSVINSQFKKISEEFGIDIDGRKHVDALSHLDRSLVSLLKAIIKGSSLIILHDIGNLLEEADLARFHDVLHRCTEKGISFLYICNNYEEIFPVADRLCVAEKGRVLRVLERGDFEKIPMGRDTLDPGLTGPSVIMDGDSSLRFESVTYHALREISFSLSTGECGLFWDQSDAVIGDITRLLQREARPESGAIFFEGKILPPRSKIVPIGVIREMPHRTMIFPDMSSLDNLCFLVGQRNPALWGKSSYKKNIRDEYYPYIGEDIDQVTLDNVPKRSLYSLVFYRYHIFRPRLLVIIQPFLDADIPLKLHILTLIGSLRTRGTSILLLDNNVTDSAVIADKTWVVNRGKLIKEFSKGEMNHENHRFG